MSEGVKCGNILFSLHLRLISMLDKHMNNTMFMFCGSSPWEVEKVLLQARLLSGRFCIEALSGHWVSWNKDGLCTLPEGWNTPDKHKGTVEEFLLSCSSLSPTRRSLSPLLDTFMSSNPDLAIIIRECLSADPVQFWLDCSTMLPVIIAVQTYGDIVHYSLFKISRNYCHFL